SAWRLVAQRVPDAQLHLIGKGTLTEVADGLARQGVKWEREVRPSEVAASFDASRALLLPSASEGLPRIGVEAFLRGRGVVGTRAGGIPDLVEDGVSGLLVGLGDTHALAAAIERVLSEDGLAERLGEGAAAAAERWVSTPEEYADRVFAVVEAVLA